MNATTYRDYSRARIGFFFGLTGWQLAAVTTGVLPALWEVSLGEWASAAAWLAAWVVMTLLVITPVRGRSSTGWMLAATTHALGAVAGWSRFTSHAATGAGVAAGTPDLPGVLATCTVHDAPPTGPLARRVALVQHHASRTWAVTAAVVHPGIGLSEPGQRDLQGAGLSGLLDAARATELVDEIQLMVRTVPEDGAERDAWVSRHRPPGAPTVARRVNEELQAALSFAAVRTESFVSVLVPEARLGKAAREAGGGIEGRAQVLLGVLAEIEAHLRSGLGMSEVTWLTSPELAVACRTGFAPGDRAGIIDALTRHGAADVPWALAGPSGADAAARHYSHDAWNSITATVLLPVRGALMGSLAPVLVPGAGERRSVLVAYPITAARAASRQTASSEWSADMADGLRSRARMRQSARSAHESARVRDLDHKLARGHALVRAYALVSVTAPKTARIAEHGRRLDASIRAAGFAPLRMDLSQDAAFAAATIPLGVSLTRGRA
ncbi:SCO6880 family protein [Arthrobacter sp. NEB 688]|uniref:SCO6880 family protein n=1 Tax=Arthrobacter sp. NEB 688 TaxID=904039 RepID=UPI001564C3F0|nr:SCO6880 family protein [Arthrobacter sp. NEB 688]QKE85116.1 PrgI family protein [Arthrobacter sp. NEB 688]